jgi:hypothetical protein
MPRFKNTKLHCLPIGDVVECKFADGSNYFTIISQKRSITNIITENGIQRTLPSGMSLKRENDIWSVGQVTKKQR